MSLPLSPVNDWSAVAAALVRSECGVNVPETLLRSYQAKFEADKFLDAGNFAEAIKKYTEALEGCPASLLEPLMPSEEEAFEANSMAEWAGGIWYESRNSSVLYIPKRSSALGATEVGFYGGSLSFGPETTRGVLRSFTAPGPRGLLRGVWEDGQKVGSFVLQLNRQGHGFAGELFDDQGNSLGLWYGIRYLPLGPPSAPPPLGFAWLFNALVSRARAQLAIESVMPTSLARVERDITSALALWPRAIEPLLIMAEIYEKRGDLWRAIETYEEILFLQPPVTHCAL